MNIFEIKKYKTNIKDKYYFFGDNILESIAIIEQFIKYYSDIEIISTHYQEIYDYVYLCESGKMKIELIATSFFHRGNVPPHIRSLISNIDKPDVIVYSEKEEKVIFGFESTETVFAGNATWQRSGRIINFLESRIPFAFLGYYSKIDRSSKGDSIRRSSELFPMFFLSLIVKYQTPAILTFFEHEDSSQRYNPIKPSKDTRIDLFNYFGSILFNKSNELIESALLKCYQDMIQYLTDDANGSKKPYINNFDLSSLYDIFAKDFAKKLLNNQIDHIYSEGIFNSFMWSPRVPQMSLILTNQLKKIKFYQLSKASSKAGITLQTKEFIELINSINPRYYVEDNLEKPVYESIKRPTVIIPIKFTKQQFGKTIYTADPYNGEISAFSEIYNSSFKKCNIVVIILDSDKITNYEDIKNIKTYKSIYHYANIILDKDMKVIKKELPTHLNQLSRKRFEDTSIQEDFITTLLYNALKLGNKDVSFINPPGSSWSDMVIYPERKFIYFERNIPRPDVVYYDSKMNSYNIGESKGTYKSFENNLDKEINKIDEMEKIISIEIGNKKIKKFVIFYGTIIQAKEILASKLIDYVLLVSQDDKLIYIDKVE